MVLQQHVTVSGLRAGLAQFYDQWGGGSHRSMLPEKGNRGPQNNLKQQQCFEEKQTDLLNTVSECKITHYNAIQLELMLIHQI